MTRDVKLTHRSLFCCIISRIYVLREWLNISIKYLAMSCLFLTGFLSASNISQWPCFMKLNKQHRKVLLHHSELVLPPHAKANSTGTGNHTTTLPLIATCSCTGQNGPVGKEVAVHSTPFTTAPSASLSISLTEQSWLKCYLPETDTAQQIQ